MQLRTPNNSTAAVADPTPDEPAAAAVASNPDGSVSLAVSPEHIECAEQKKHDTMAHRVYIRAGWREGARRGIVCGRMVYVKTMTASELARLDQSKVVRVERMADVDGQ